MSLAIIGLVSLGAILAWRAFVGWIGIQPGFGSWDSVPRYDEEE